MTRWERIMEIDMPFIQNKQEEAFLLRRNNINKKTEKDTPNNHKEKIG